MKILCVGGGSGGHVTPVVAVCKEIARRAPRTDLRFICDRKFAAQSRKLFADTHVSVTVIASGKFRRFANLKLRDHVRHAFITYWKNIIDAFKIVGGFVHSFFILLTWRPDAIFAKGGFVCLPVGLAAWVLRVPLVIHDSDTHPGLTNRILSRFASAIGTGAPVEFYPSYPTSRTKFIGIPIGDEFHVANTEERAASKKKLGFDVHQKLVAVSGGGQGSQSINLAIVAAAPKLLASGVQIFLPTGAKNFDQVQAKINTSKELKDTGKGFQVLPFVNGFADVLAAADIVVARAGASTLAELAATASATILVPHPYLASDHQTKNARAYAEKGAAVVIDERGQWDDPVRAGMVFAREILALARDEHKRKVLAQKMHEFARPNALSDMVAMILEVANREMSDGKNDKRGDRDDTA